MKSSTVALVVLTTSAVQAFVPVAFTRGVPSQVLFSEPEKQQEEAGLDLDLEEMFDM